MGNMDDRLSGIENWSIYFGRGGNKGNW